jgi:hypothetical protein
LLNDTRRWREAKQIYGRGRSRSVGTAGNCRNQYSRKDDGKWEKTHYVSAGRSVVLQF